MKKFLTILLLLAPHIIAGLFLTILIFSRFSFALDVNDNGIIKNEVMGGINGSQRPTCVDNWNEWPHSHEQRADIPHPIQFMPGEDPHENVGIREFFLNMNNDNLLDYIYANKTQWDRTQQIEECVALNTGSGWNISYRCVVRRDAGNDPTYYGDCAAE